MSLLRLVPVLLMAACGSTRATTSAPPGTGEQGLAVLRDALDLHPTVGFVERGAETWLVHGATGQRIARVVAPPDAKCTQPHPNVLFEGEPGIGATFERGSASFYQWDATRRCVVAAGELKFEPPKAESLLFIDQDLDGPGDDDAETPHEATVGRYVVTLTPDAFELRVGRDGAVLHHEDFDHDCTYTAGVDAVTDARGVLWINVTYTNTTRGWAESCEAAATELGASDDRDDALDLWITVRPDGRTEVVQRRHDAAVIAENEGGETLVFALPDGQLRYEETTIVRDGREGIHLSASYTWTLAPRQGAAVTLASGEE